MRLLYSLLALVSAASTLVAWTPFETDVMQTKVPSDPEILDHMVPLRTPVWANPKLKLPAPYLVAYRAAPSFSHSYLVYVAKTGDEFEVTTVEFGDTEEPQPAKRARISKEAAADVYWIWTNALLDVRYMRAPHNGTDGTTRYFTTWVKDLGDLTGETWEPTGDLPPKWMADAGDYLFQYVFDGKRKPGECEAYFADLKKRLVAYYRTRIAQ